VCVCEGESVCVYVKRARRQQQVCVCEGVCVWESEREREKKSVCEYATYSSSAAGMFV